MYFSICENELNEDKNCPDRGQEEQGELIERKGLGYHGYTSLGGSHLDRKRVHTNAHIRCTIIYIYILSTNTQIIYIHVWYTCALVCVKGPSVFIHLRYIFERVARVYTEAPKRINAIRLAMSYRCQIPTTIHQCIFNWPRIFKTFI